jgi:hypothetical protein
MTDSEFKNMVDNMPNAEFKNANGDKLFIHSSGTKVFMRSDEVKKMLDGRNKIVKTYIPLFDRHFNTWTKEELYQVGKAIMEIHK